MRQWLGAFAFVCVLLAAATAEAKRVALVIGNGAYVDWLSQQPASATGCSPRRNGNTPRVAKPNPASIHSIRSVP